MHNFATTALLTCVVERLLQSLVKRINVRKNFTGVIIYYLLGINLVKILYRSVIRAGKLNADVQVSFIEIWHQFKTIEVLSEA